MLPRKQVRLDPRLPWLADLRILLSPMSGVTDRAFRDCCRPFGMDMGFCEFASAAGLCHENEATWRLIDTEGEAGLVGIQIFGSAPEQMAAAARSMVGRRLDVLDLNFGCPAKKVVKKCGGSALLADVPLLADIVQAVVAESPVPVTAKIRSGWDDQSVNYQEVGLLLQELGCVWVTLHSRTRHQKFRGEADWTHIASLVETLDIPVIGNGDVVDAATYRALKSQTACYAVMVGRGAIGNPWLFQVMAAVEQGAPAPAPSWAEMCEVMSEYIRTEAASRGERSGLLVTRKHIARCFRNYRGAAALRKRLFSAEFTTDMRAILAEVGAAGQPLAESPELTNPGDSRQTRHEPDVDPATREGEP
ncbi:MAG: tRNA-dihydrouridine synthase [bacterium]